jgi:hypothetical protein
MNRRGFLAALAGGAAAAADPDRLIWTPGRLLISIPPPRRYTLYVRLPPRFIVRNGPGFLPELPELILTFEPRVLILR